MTTKHVTSKADGTIPGLRVVGYHGRLGPNQTPARRPPVYADDEGMPGRIRASEPGPSGTFSLTIEFDTKAIPEDVWATTGTRIEPAWTATLAAPLILILGPRELRVVHELRKLGGEPEQPALDEILAWVETETLRSDTLRCVRIGELLAWNCTRALADALAARIATIARRQVTDAAREGQRHELRGASFWLSRAAVCDADVFLAAAGLRRAGFEQWEELVHAGVQSGTKARRLASVDEAEASLRTRADRASYARRAVFRAQDDLPAASRRANAPAARRAA